MTRRLWTEMNDRDPALHGVSPASHNKFKSKPKASSVPRKLDPKIAVESAFRLEEKRRYEAMLNQYVYSRESTDFSPKSKPTPPTRSLFSRVVSNFSRFPSWVRGLVIHERQPISSLSIKTYSLTENLRQEELKRQEAKLKQQQEELKDQERHRQLQEQTRRSSLVPSPTLSGVPESSTKFKDELAKFKTLHYPNYYSNLRKIETDQSHRDEVDEIESRLKKIRLLKGQEHENIKKIRSSIPETRSSFYPEFVPPPREFKEEQPEEEEIEVDEDDSFVYSPSIDEINAFIDDRFAFVTNDEQVLIEKYDIPIKLKDLETLEALNWLNDEVINFYFQMIMERSQTVDNLPKVYVFNTFFYTKLCSGPNAYNMLRRWTRILIPLHLGMHWTLCAVNCKKQRISYYDSMGGGRLNGKGARYQKDILAYLQKEHIDKKGSDLPPEWRINEDGVDDEDNTNQVIPQQQNGSDCGVFTCRFAEYISRRARFNFSQEQMPYFRRKMIFEILNGNIVNKVTSNDGFKG